MSIKIQENIALSPYTIYKIGGPAKFFAEVKGSEDLREALNFAAEKNLPIFILGAGSNVLVSDKGFDGLVIRMAGGEIKVDGEMLVVDAGVMMAHAVLKSAQAGLSGFEWGIGVPGTVGGSVRGNAGCFGSEIKNIIESVEVFDSVKAIPRPTSIGRDPGARRLGTSYKLQDTSPDVKSGSRLPYKAVKMGRRDCEFGYRDSIFKKHPEWVILSATLKLKKGDPKVIQENIKRISADRTQKQDIGTKSCGCIFKNIPWGRKDIDKNAILKRFPNIPQSGTVDGIPVSYLISEAGLKGRRVGHVFISPKHANYFVNDGGATAEEVLMLITIAKDTVRRKYGISLEEEIQYVGF